MSSSVVPHSVLKYWFQGYIPNEPLPSSLVQLWFQSTSEQDAYIQSTFQTAMEEAATGKLDHFKETVEGRLALLILLDQFPRNAYRNTAQMFQYDAQAVQFALEAISTEQDLQVPSIQRIFFYLPLEHDESIENQRLCVEKCHTQWQQAPAMYQELWKGFHHYAVEHQQLIEQFGRFPHRNVLLGRTNTAEEEAYLKANTKVFGVTVKK